MAKRDVVAIGGSMGASHVLQTVLSGLGPGFRGSILVCTHMPAQGLPLLAERLSRTCRLPVSYAQEGERVEPGRVYLPAPDRHLLVIDGVLHHGRGPRENMVRPAIDPLFRSVAATYGPRAVGVLLTGMLNDGASGVAAISRCGGAVIVQDPETALAPDMPRAACRVVQPDYLAPPDQIAGVLEELAQEEAAACNISPPDGLQLEIEIALGRRLGSRRLKTIADPAPLTSPQCSGVLSRLESGPPLRFRCQTGHGFTADVLQAQQAERVEEAMRIALRLMEERVELMARLAEDARAQNRGAVAAIYENRRAEYEAHAGALREGVMDLLEKDEDALVD